MVINKALFSHKSVHWSTPQETYDALNKEFNFTFDPCPLQSDDKTSLLKDWGSRVFVNPPYNNIRNFMEKAVLEIQRERVQLAVFLVPSRTDTSWWHDFVMKHAKEVRYIRGRLKFGGHQGSAPFPSCVVVF